MIHNIAVYDAGGAFVDDARSPLEMGPRTQTLGVPAQPAGSYAFKCDAHPVEMVGVLEIH